MKKPSLTVLRRKFGSLSVGIGIAMCVGLLAPAVVGGYVLTTLRQDQRTQDLENQLKDKLELLALSLVDPVWNIDTQATASILTAMMRDPEIVRIVVSDPMGRAILGNERIERRLGAAQVGQREIIRSGAVVGRVEVEIDDGLSQRAYRNDRLAYVLVLACQFALALGLILYALRRRVLRPLAALTGFSDQIAKGNLDSPLDWARPDEIGHLARQLDHMRISLKTSLTERNHAAAQLRLSATVFENTADGVMITDAQQHIVAVNRSFERITGYSQAEVLGKSPSLLSSGRQGPEFYEALWHSLDDAGRWSGELWNRRKTGEIYPEHLAITAVKGASGKLDHYVSVFSDITFRKAAENEITQLAFYDSLTQLPNRRLMLDRLGQALTSSARHHRHGALMLIDLDNFKSLNDTLGHDVGDQLLVHVAARLESCIRDGDTVARLGGDEFVLILEDLDKEGLAAMQAEAVAQKVLAELKKPYLLELTLDTEQRTQRSHDCTSSLGIALFRDQSITVDELMKRADTAMYQAKAAGRNTLRFFDPEMQEAVAARAALEFDLRRALLEKQFLLYYQAQVDSSDRVIGAEVLLRWQHPMRGLVTPVEFIPLAEETGLILPLGQWVLEAACGQLAAWAEQPQTRDLTLAVNVSARQFRQSNFVEQVLSTVSQLGADPHKLKLELTESMLVDNVDDIIEKMTILKAHGVNFSMDDFGTGYSSLSYLKLLPIYQLKIDRSFVRDVLTDTNDAAIARTIVALGQSLGLSVIAEGVETQSQRDFLAASGCTFYQGYFFSRPLPLNEFATYLDNSRILAKQY